MNIINDEDIPRATLEELQEINTNLKLIAQQLSGIKMKVGLTAPKQHWENNAADQLRRIAELLGMSTTNITVSFVRSRRNTERSWIGYKQPMKTTTSLLLTCWSWLLAVTTCL